VYIGLEVRGLILDRFKEPDEDDVAEFSSCSQCPEIINVGDEYYEHYGMVSCLSILCLMKMTGTVKRVAEDDEE
jgi:hypothetical protein